jgi:hypothetical protein
LRWRRADAGMRTYQSAALAQLPTGVGTVVAPTPPHRSRAPKLVSEPIGPLRNESRGRVNDGLLALIHGCGEDGGNDRLRERKLLLFECPWIEATFGIERENGKRRSNDAHWLSGHQFDDHIGHACALPGKSGQAVVGRLPQHPLEFGGWQLPESIVTGNEKLSARKPHSCPHGL